MYPQKRKGPAESEALTVWIFSGSALAGLEPALGLVDHIDPALAAHDAAIAVALLERTERVANFHSPSPHVAARRLRLVTVVPPLGGDEFDGGRYKVRTCDPFDVNEVLYR